MTKNPIWNAIKQYLVTHAAYDCKTIFQIGLRPVISTAIAFSMVACGPGKTSNYVTSYGGGGDKKDDGGYGNGGTGDGGGGQGILCSSSASNPAFQSKLFVRDIFELLYNSKKEPIKVPSENGNSSQISEAAIRILVKQLRAFFGPATDTLEFGNESFWRNFSQKISFVDKDAALFVSQDANSPIALPAGCKIVQIAYWDDSVGNSSDGTLYVENEKWQQLDQLNKVALLAHEYFFKEARKSAYKNSDFIRGRVGEILSVNGGIPLFSKWLSSPLSSISSVLPNKKSGFKYCVGTSEEDPSAKVVLYQYKGSDDKSYFVIPYLRSNVISKSSLLRSEFDIQSIDKSLTDLMYLNESTAIEVVGNKVRDVEWFNFKMNSVGLQSTDGGYLASGILKWDFGKNGARIWQNYLQRGTGSPIRLSLDIPKFIDAVSSTPNLSREEISRLILTTIASTITKTAAPVMPVNPENADEKFVEYDETRLTNALLTLRSEVAFFVSKGQMVGEFPKWKAALLSLEKYYSEQLEGLSVNMNGFTRGSLMSNTELSTYPVLLLKNEAGFLDVDDLATIKILNERKANKVMRSKKSSLLVESNSDKILFSLTCSDYNSVYTGVVVPKTSDSDSWDYAEHDVKFDVANLKPLDQKTQKSYSEVLQYLSEKAKGRYQYIEGSCNSTVEQESARCNEEYDFYRLISGESAQVEVTGCTNDDLEVAITVRSERNASFKTESVFSCMNFKINGERYFKVFAEPSAYGNVEKALIISVPPPQATLDN